MDIKVFLSATLRTIVPGCDQAAGSCMALPEGAAGSDACRAPGDRVGFIPRGVPGPYRLFLVMIQHSGGR